jgi:hypothetical protein
LFLNDFADSDDFFEACDPNRDNLCLYGKYYCTIEAYIANFATPDVNYSGRHQFCYFQKNRTCRLVFFSLSVLYFSSGQSDGTWNVDLPAAEVPPELPEPVLGINFARDGMEKKDWLALCAVHSDAWLMSVLFFYAARFDDTGRAELFSLVNQHPTVYEVATGRVSRNKMFKHRHHASGRSPAGGPPMHGNGGGATPGQPQLQFFFQGPVSSTTPAASGRLLVESDVTPALVGRQAELYWPDDAKWYLVAIQQLDLRTSKAK